LKHSRILACRLLLVPLLVLLSCYYSKAQPPPGTVQNCIVDIDVASCTVTVSHCTVDANNDPWVNRNDTVTWKASTASTTYSIDFKRYLSVFSHTPVSASTISSGHPETVLGDLLCKKHVSCYYKYSLTRQGETKACVDPGVRVVPPPSANFVLYLALVALVGLVGLVSFAVWRSRARKRALSLK
jgi:hypothetical protein